MYHICIIYIGQSLKISYFCMYGFPLVCFDALNGWKGTDLPVPR